MDVALAVIGAVIATGFALHLFSGWRTRTRLHTEIWAVAFAAYALATWSLAYGSAFGWTSFNFRTFYFLGAIANISLLAAGSIALKSEKAGRRVLSPVILWLVFGFFAAFLAPFVMPLPAAGIPAGSEVFGYTFTIEALTLPGPRMFAAFSGAVGSVVIITLAVVSALRAWKPMRRLAYGNLLIVAGVLAPAFGGVLVARGEPSALPLSLAVGITLLWWGYRMASSAK